MSTAHDCRLVWVRCFKCKKGQWNAESCGCKECGHLFGMYGSPLR